MSVNPLVLHLHTYFLFPFHIDQNAVMDEHPEIWREGQHYFEGLDQWVTRHVVDELQPAANVLGAWQRHPESRFDLDSPTSQDKMFFHPFMRRAFFDSGGNDPDHQSLVHHYTLPISPGHSLYYEAEDCGGESARVPITSMRLLMFANGVGILAMGVEAHNVSFSQALWINEMMRKIYPSSRRQIETARIPNRLRLMQETATGQRTVAEESWQSKPSTAHNPPLSSILRSLLPFANYEHEEFEATLDERMIVNTFLRLDRTQLATDFEYSEDYEIAFSRLLYVDRAGEGYRYQPEFIQEQMEKQVYRRWQHEGTLYGMTSYSSVTSILAIPGSAQSDDIVHRMFCTKHLVLANIALFYRASLLNFARESALVSRQLFPVFSGGAVRHRHIQFATHLMADFHYFNTYWFHLEPTNKDEELEHFQMLSTAYQLGPMKQNIEDQIDSLAGFIDRLFALRNNDAVNRLAMMSVLLGIGALVTGYFGMNIPNLTAILEKPAMSFWTLVLTSLMAVASLWFVFHIISSNWLDYRASILPHLFRRPLSPRLLRQLRRSANN